MNNYQTTSRIAIISFSPISRDARVLRQVEYLSKHFPVTVMGYGNLDTPLNPNIEMVSMVLPAGLIRHLRATLLLLLGRIFPQAYEAWYWGRAHHQAALAWLLERKACAIHANEWNTLPLAAKAAKITGAYLVLDLHEYSPLEGEDQWYWRIFYKPAIEYFLKQYLSAVSTTVTVSQTIADRYEAEWGVQPRVVMNLPASRQYPDFRPTEPDRIRLIHHGLAFRKRQLELMIHTVAATDPRYSLNFMLTGPDLDYIAELKNLAQRVAPERIFFHQPVAPAEIVSQLAQFDMGIYPLPTTHNFNNLAALPNKFFDFITAGLAVCIGPSLEMARLTEEHGFGVVASSIEPDAIAKVLNNLSAADIDRMKLRAIEARHVLNAEVEMGKLTALYSTLLEAA